ncbi:MAG: TIR domain-containing protein [Holosporaceae bacterium]|jgi:hypothetical protein|nr:TIR domain-containing protein [Holosporaceae bacterium]
MRTYNIFISHSWKYDEDYQRLIGLLDKEPCFQGNYRDYSVTKDEPILSKNGNKLTDQGLMARISEQIRSASVVLIPVGIYATHSDWINEEIKIAKGFGKPIIAIKPWGTQRVSSVVKDAIETVGWNGSSIVDAIKRHTK